MNDLRIALAFLTILPVGYVESESPGRSFAFFPLIGLLIGFILASAAYALRLWLSAELAALGVVVLWVVLTGGLHLDGFADACDGLLATVEPVRRLEIMKDPRTGSWAVVGLILLLLSKWLTVREAAPVALILPPVIGRWIMVLAAFGFPYARSEGLGAFFRRGLRRRQVVLATSTVVILVIIWSLLFDWRELVSVVMALVLMIVIGRWASIRLGGGLTGDVYGALCELSEVIVLLLMSTL